MNYLKGASYPIECCHCTLQNVVSQAQTMPPMSQAAPTNGMGYMGYQPYNMQNMISALPGQDPNLPPQQPYMPGQQPMYQQVSLLIFIVLLPGVTIKIFVKSLLFLTLCQWFLVLTECLICRWLPLVARSNSHSSNNRSRLLRPCPAALRHSSSPSTEGHDAGGSDTLHPLPFFWSFPRTLWTDDTLWKYTHLPSFHLAVMLWQCKILWWCCSTVAVLGCPPLKDGRVGGSCKRGLHNSDPLPSFPLFTADMYVVLP